VRSLVLEVKSSDYVRTARAKGLHEFSVLRRHVLRNSMIPVITFVGLQLPFLIGGTVIFENIFSLPGTGQFLLGAVNQRDYPVILALNMLFALVVICSNLVIDLAYVAIDPRIRLS
jgi:peptide/nickel transport system permease protein